MTTLNWLSISFIIAAGHGVFLSLSLWGKTKRQHPANRYLIILLICVVISLLLRLTYSENNDLFQRFPHLSIAGDFVMFLIGPTLYFYTRKLLEKGFYLQKKHGVHLIPLLLFLLSFVYLLTMSRSELLAIHVDGKIYTYYIILLSSAILHISAYAVAGLGVLRRYKQKFFQAYSEDHRVRYLQLVLLAMLSVALCWIPGHFQSLLSGFNPLLSNFFYQLSFLLMSVLVFVIGFYAIREPKIFSLPIAVEKVKYRHSKLDNKTAASLKDQLLKLFDQERPYLDPTLSLKALAKKLDINHVHLSQVINEQCGKNFYDLVNEYRVNAFIEKAQSGAYKNFTLLAIALESGFKTKSSFNAAFKKMTGTTPSRFLKANPTNFPTL